jgi:RHH-type transcriptional regulator, proline utilization regulon repressor / proline dehydrogenase / delta 1-pyrroline-5-carboxylate dehydrogenase
VITEAADIDAAVKDLVKSAFGHAGQKCSAASLAIVEATVYDSAAFRRQLLDAVSSLRVGRAWELTTAVAPVITTPGPSLQRALTVLEPGEEWLLEPHESSGVPNLWSPGIKLGVVPGSWSHTHEWFGPVLAVMRAPDLDTAIEWANATEYGLTGGIHSLDPVECETYVERAEVGNIYVNRAITGAIVERQPFGGWKRSAVGAGAKAGGPNYLVALQHWSSPPDSTTATGLASFDHWWATEYGRGHDRSRLRAERNVLRYRPLPGVIVRVDDTTPSMSIELARHAARLTGTPLSFSAPSPGVAADAIVETDEALGDRLASRPGWRLRVLATPTPALRHDAWTAGVTIDDAPIVPDGRIELIHWLREQAVSITAHRYGSPTGAPRIDVQPGRTPPPPAAHPGRTRRAP